MKFGLDSNKPVLGLSKPTTCHWCANSLAQIRNIYKGKDCQRYYCSMRCNGLGEDRALRYRAALAGTVSSSLLVGALALIAAMLMFVFGGGHKAWAHDPSTHQGDDLAEARSDAFGSCCVGDDYSKLRVGEWETTETGYRVFYKGRWLEASRRVKVSNMENPDGEAKAWIFGEGNTAYIRCFMAGARS